MNTLYKISPLFLAALIVLGGCAGSDEASTAEPPDTVTTTLNRRVVRVETMVLAPSPFEEVIEITGAVEATYDANLSAQSSGTLTSLLPLGRTVSKGEVIAEIDSDFMKAAVRQAQAQVDVAQAQYNLAEDTFNRQQPLFQDSIISALEFEGVRTQLSQAEAQLAQSNAMLAQAEEQLDNTRITAPFAGTIEQHLAQTGEQLAPGLPVLRLVNTSTVKINAGVPERFAADIRRGTPVEISFKAYGGESVSGEVSFVGSVINTSNRTFPVEIELDNHDGRYKPEMIANVYVTRKQLQDQLVVPQTAVLRDENGISMYVVSHSDSLATAHRRAISLGPSYAGRVVITDGLQAGTEVIVVGQTTVTEGDAVEVVN